MTKYVLVGTGGRSRMYIDALADQFASSSKLLAICDSNQGRRDLVLRQYGDRLTGLESYAPEDFDKMLQEQKPDCVIVCTKDSTHSDYICRALELDCDVITEKPMTTDEKKCQRIIDTVKKTGKKVSVMFNYRYSPVREQVKKILASGIIGKVCSVDFQWMLDTRHGADYYRRWHRNKANSGGLMVHKATHHFDLVNWWLGSVPVSVFAEGGKVFYDYKQAQRHGLKKHGDRCMDCNLKNRCNFYFDLNSSDKLRQIYLQCEEHDNYYRDKCLFADEIDIEDTMNVVVKYENNQFLSYSLNSFCAWEGYRISFNGTKGRLEHNCRESSYVNSGGMVEGAFNPEGTTIQVFPFFKTPFEVKIDQGVGGHGGGDILMLNDIFGSTNHQDPYMKAADYIHGAYSILVGIAANKSMANGQKVFIKDLVNNLGRPEMSAMPDGSEKIEYVDDTSRLVKDEFTDAGMAKRIGQEKTN